jgi:RNA polymerase sigma-70 factor (ECF subfamily)
MMSVAYRMLGSVADAEDAVQDAYLRLQSAEEVNSAEGFLVKTTTQRCIDQLRTCQRRKKYIGPWVPEPIDTKSKPANTDLSESLSQAFLLMLERLSPNERAAYLLRTVFDYEYSQIAQVLGKSEVYARQIVSRAKARLTQETPRSRCTPREADRLAERFIEACRSGDVTTVEQLFTESAEVHSDGGGKVSAARVVIRGRHRASRFLVGVFKKQQRYCRLATTTVNGEPGVVFSAGGIVIQVVSLCLNEGVRAVFMTSNPDKLTRWSQAEIE